MGHIFVARGDLTKLACDGLLIPCDSTLNVNDVWQDVLPVVLSRARFHPDWLVLRGQPDAAGLVDLPSVDGRSVWAFVAVEAVDNSVERVVERTLQALKRAAKNVEAKEGRAAPVIGLPLVGTGHGGLDRSRAEVVEVLLERLRESPLPADVILMLLDRRDFSAVQERRRDEDWVDLPHELRSHADRLGKLAAQGELALFLGAGVSRPVGLPDWWDLLDSLAKDAGCAPPDRTESPFVAATPIVDALADQYQDSIKALLAKRQHGVGHALLASIGVKRMVTTNFDSCMELALAAPTRGDFSVLTRQLARNGSPWLLKLNGDIDVPSTIVLTDRDLIRHPEERRALEGVVQSLLLTSHLFFVGFSLTDDNFLQLADAVSKVRERASGGRLSKTGTALALTAEECSRAGYTDLYLLEMDPSSRAVGARLLEIFLDRLAWAATTQGALGTEYLLDERYESGLSSYGNSLREVLFKMLHEANSDARSSPAWRQVADCLRSLGADESLLIASGPWPSDDGE